MSEPIIDPTTRTAPWPGRFTRVSTKARDATRSVNLHARITDGPSDATALFCVHGLGGSATNWTDLATALSGIAPSIAIDLPGWGLSDPAPDGDYSIAAASRWTIAAIETLADGPIDLLGNSMGGLIAIRVAAERPDLVRTLTLVSPAVPGLEAPTEADPRMAVLAVPYLGDRIQHRLNTADALGRARMTAEICFAHPEVIPQQRLEEQADEILVRNGYPWAIPAFSRSLRSIVGTFLHRRKDNPWRLATTLDVPTTIIWGDKDRLVPVSRAPRLQAVIAGSELHILPDVGHTAQMEAPVATAEIVRDLLDGQRAAGVDTAA